MKKSGAQSFNQGGIERSEERESMRSQEEARSIHKLDVSFDRHLMTPNPYFFIVIFVGVAIAFPLMPLALAWLWRRFFQPPKPGAGKNAIYECGVESLGEAQVQFRSQYYLYCIIFLIFDVEAIFLVPFAVAFTGLPVGAFIAILVFLLLLIEGLVWAWSKGCLNWAK